MSLLAPARLYVREMASPSRSNHGRNETLSFGTGVTFLLLAQSHIEAISEQGSAPRTSENFIKKRGMSLCAPVSGGSFCALPFPSDSRHGMNPCGDGSTPLRTPISAPYENPAFVPIWARSMAVQIPSPPKIGMVSLGCPKALVDSERILTKLR